MAAGGLRPLVVIGLDGATFDLLIPWMRAGRLPELARLWESGAWGQLESTIPAATFPAWTSLFTGVNPGRHGVLDFLQQIEGTHRLRLVGRRDRRVAALWTHVARAGGRVAVLTVPVTYPPEPVPGVMVSGWDSPLATAIDGSFVHPPGFHDQIRTEIGRLPFADFQEMIPGPGWHERALQSLLDGIERRTRLVELALARERWDLLAVVFGESDTAAHHFWRFHDPGSPRWVPSAHGGALAAIYEALDAAIGRIVRRIPAGAVVAIVSDHGSGGAGTRVVHLNRRLAEVGMLRFRSGSLGSAARGLRRRALAWMPHRLQGGLVRRFGALAGRLEGWQRTQGIDWRATVAYSDELDYHPNVRLNLGGREPEGIVPPSAYETVRAELAAQLEHWSDRDGRRVVERIWRREDVYSGPATALAPDLLLELSRAAGYSPACLRSDGPGPALGLLSPAQYGAGRGEGMSGAHRRDGILLLGGDGIRAGHIDRARITDVLPTLLALGGLPIPAGLDGTPLAAVIAGNVPDAGPEDITIAADVAPALAAAEVAEVRARLEALGYLEPGVG